MYENTDTVTGMFTNVFEKATTSSSSGAAGFQSSGAIDFPLVAGRYYIIGVRPRASVTTSYVTVSSAGGKQFLSFGSTSGSRPSSTATLSTHRWASRETSRQTLLSPRDDGTLRPRPHTTCIVVRFCSEQEEAGRVVMAHASTVVIVVPVTRDDDRVLPLRREASVRGDDGPAVVEQAHLGPPRLTIGSTVIAMPALGAVPMPRLPRVRDVRIGVHRAADAVPADFGHDAQPSLFAPAPRSRRRCRRGARPRG